MNNQYYSKNVSLPESWRWARLGDVCEIIMGQSPPSDTYNEKVDLQNLRIPLPPFEEQKKIVAYFNKVGETVESLKKLQQKTEEELKKLVSVILDKVFRGEL
ncbi:MAG: restriction endonuclease subunit S [Archaeoglobaceae archaeon]